MAERTSDRRQGGPPTKEDYFAAIQALGDQIEVALVVSPDLYHRICNNSDDRRDVLQAMLVAGRRAA